MSDGRGGAGETGAWRPPAWAAWFAWAWVALVLASAAAAVFHLDALALALDWARPLRGA